MTNNESAPTYETWTHAPADWKLQEIEVWFDHEIQSLRYKLRTTTGVVHELAVQGGLDRLKINPVTGMIWMEMNQNRVVSVPRLPSGENLTIDEAAAVLNRPVATLRFWRSRGLGPTSYKSGRRVMYRRADLDVWVSVAAAVNRGSE